MFTSQRDVQEWYLPSWKIEPKYSTKVLIGNWLEERKRFTKDIGKPSNSTYGTDFVRFPDCRTDQIVRRTIMKKLDGLPKQHLFMHHGEPSNRNLVTQYDDQYNRHAYNPVLPPLRRWNGQKLAWLPEKSDFPIFEPPTNYGLFEQLMKKWPQKETGMTNSVYTVSYEKPPVSAFAIRRRPVTTCHLSPQDGQHLPHNISASLECDRAPECHQTPEQLVGDTAAIGAIL
ncbi:cilia- and flagella-associated protein 107 [Emydura macquarii macquarii]|uniref:cilia- and flagella-associated protein 107 n=1 Tax=Emydura macquarii macquarii TaxID=1129001 RepID=UPI00352A80B1